MLDPALRRCPLISQVAELPRQIGLLARSAVAVAGLSLLVAAASSCLWAASGAGATTTTATDSSNGPLGGDRALWPYLAHDQPPNWHALSLEADAPIVSGVEQLVGTPAGTAYEGWSGPSHSQVIVVLSLVTQRSPAELRRGVANALIGACSGATGVTPISAERESAIQGAEQAQCNVVGGASSSAATGSKTAIAWARGDVIVTLQATSLSTKSALAAAESQNRVISPTGVPDGSAVPTFAIALVGLVVLALIAGALMIVRMRPDDRR